MAWTIRYDGDALAAINKLDKPIRARIDQYLTDTAATGRPRSRGKALSGEMVGLWRYRVGDWRIICDLQDDRLVILAIDVGHRSHIYR